MAIIGFGEAGRSFATAGGWTAHAFDRLTDDPKTREAKYADYSAAGVRGVDSLAAAIEGVELILSMVTADQALVVAGTVAESIRAGVFFFDLNSVAPQTKRAGATLIEGAGGHYLDVAVLAPVNPAQLAVPLLLSGPQASAGAAMLAKLGFSRTHALDGEVGRASAVKMIRSIVVKGIEALTAECLLAADAADVRTEVLASLDASEKPMRWAERADYNLGRMIEHGERRSAEMDEVARTLDDLGVDASMARAASRWHKAIGELHLAGPIAGIGAKLPRVRAGTKMP
ncbi:MAG: DUF1932 domain-containing protein [Sphingomonadaceae bacterium]